MQAAAATAEDLSARVEAGRARLYRRAREDVNLFAMLVLRDERTGAPIEQQPFHAAWHRAIEEHKRVVLWGPIEFGKSQQWIARALWKIGRNPSTRGAYLSNTQRPQAEDFMIAVKGHIERNAVLHAIFPEIQRGSPWTDTRITVQRPGGIKGPTLQGVGMHGNIQGARLDWIIVDDMLDFENTRTPAARDDCHTWFKKTPMGRLADGAEVVYSNNVWHPDDPAHRLARDGWFAIREPAIRADGTPLWGARWPLARLMARKAPDDLGALEFARQLLCQARDDSTSRFQAAWIEACKERGRGRSLSARYDGSLPTYTGVDLGSGKDRRSAAVGAAGAKRKNDLTSLVTIARHPDGTRELLDVQAGDWQSPEIVRRIVSAHQRYRSILFVESNATQEHVAQWVRNVSAVPVRSFDTTGARKHDPRFGFESLALEMEGRKWIIPCGVDGRCHPEVQALVDELLYYDPNGHTGDRAMAAWLAREAARAGLLPGPVNVQTNISSR